MPFYPDDFIHDVTYEYFYYATFFAAETLEIEYESVGEPPLFRPVNPSPYTLQAFNNRVNFFVEHLFNSVQSASASQ